MIIRSRAPLRLSLAGGGTDVSPYCELYGGCVLNATIDLYAYCTLEVWDSNQIVFSASDKEQIYTSELTDFLEFDGNLDLHKGVYNRIVREYHNGEPLALKLTTYSDVPAGSGLGSSSTLVVAMIKAYVELLNLPLGDYDIAHIAYEIERIEVGLNGGKQDQYAATFGGFNFIEFYADDRVIVNPLRIKNWIISELESCLVLYYTGVSRESAKIIEQQSKNVAQNNEKSLEAMHEIKHYSFVFKEALLKGDVISIAKNLKRAWEAKKKTAQNISNDDIDKVYDMAVTAGAWSGKISGAGGGGFMMFIVDPVRREKVIKNLRKYGGEVIGCHFTKRGTEGWKIY
ncbi:MAG: GHMP kinase [Xenococcaceae cyanobacterium MO_234.B1]|nr:GHMP kinase [Xenococcaceae cyanobacterium MO_234.B1]